MGNRHYGTNKNPKQNLYIFIMVAFRELELIFDDLFYGFFNNKIGLLREHLLLLYIRLMSSLRDMGRICLGHWIFLWKMLLSYWNQWNYLRDPPLSSSRASELQLSSLQLTFLYIFFKKDSNLGFFLKEKGFF